jgi:protein-S-isoprenylcysteine O-methyltransferase
MRRIALVYGLIVVFFTSDRFLRRGLAATRLHAGESDQGSTRAVGQAFAKSTLALFLAPGLTGHGLGLLPWRERLLRLGVGGMVTGLLLRAWATQVLGASYTRTLQVGQEQRIIQSGPYRVIRHPGYAGTLLVWLGAAMALANWIVAAFVSITLLRVYGRQMAAEEEMLLKTFPAAYQEYMRQTWRLVPFVTRRE